MTRPPAAEILADYEAWKNETNSPPDGIFDDAAAREYARAYVAARLAELPTRLDVDRAMPKVSR